MYGGIAVFTILFAIDLLVIQPIWGWKVSMAVNSYSKLPFFILALWMALPSVFTLQNKLAVYILTGTSLLLLPAFFTVFCDLMPGSYKIFWSNTARSFTLNNSGITLYMYDMKIGIMLEMFCFVLGLSYKTKLDRLRMQMLGSEVEKLRNEHLALIPSNGPNEDPFIAEVRKIVEANLDDENFSAEMLANAMHLSRVQLYRKMMASAKVPPSDFIRSVRVATAKDKLRNTTKSISEIAFEVGFKDASHFSNAFYKIVGMRPSKYRELQSQNSTISPSNSQNET
jgi:AraC-like DNA-binding protein